MKATITSSGPLQGTQINYKTLHGLHKQLCYHLAHSETLQAITATTDTGAVVHVELWSNCDYIRTRAGRYLTI